jgi:hypothetical protein
MKNTQNNTTKRFFRDGWEHRIQLWLSYNRFSSIGDSSYSEICGGFIEGVYEWANHNQSCGVTESANAKYIGYTIFFNDDCGYGLVHAEGFTSKGWVMTLFSSKRKNKR